MLAQLGIRAQRILISYHHVRDSDISGARLGDKVALDVKPQRLIAFNGTLICSTDRPLSSHHSAWTVLISAVQTHSIACIHVLHGGGLSG
jgi:hypothetical protein